MSSAAFFAAIRPMFGGKFTQAQVDGINGILRATKGLPVSWQAYALATVLHETAQSMEPVKETVMPWHKNKHPSDATVIARLDRAFKKGQLRGVKTPYWRQGWFGRGYPQLTHERNYRAASALVGVDLVKDRDKALDPDISAIILVEGMKAGTFTGKKFADYLPGHYGEARRIINGTDKAAEVAAYAEAFEAALRLDTPSPDVEPVPDQPEPWWEAIIAALLRILRGK